MSFSLVGGPTGEAHVEMKYQLLNPATHFREVVDAARAVVLAGGTMSPVRASVSVLLVSATLSAGASLDVGLHQSAVFARAAGEVVDVLVRPHHPVIELADTCGREGPPWGGAGVQVRKQRGHCDCGPS